MQLKEELVNKIMKTNFEQLEIDINKKVSTRGKESFIFKLDKLNTFDTVDFDKIINDLYLLNLKYKENGKTEFYIELLKKVTLFFQHILFLFYCHYNDSDNYKISNISDIEDLTNIYQKIRQISSEIIW
ncbi:hypothetical protein I2486_18385 [Cellulophaga sp. E16_2]|uniref:Uncharacterized protein n=1 Tax=Cellulophaga algicola (strain DSM 14237 / IC166 / ACAM 630) TaxID=688270 RepID=E6XAM1_CELAD|nr:MULTISPECIES: hypothetical protein [Cellulophaga]ADV50983.1 hypothetical protein Celal_3732 [Cellulophaga algicola DSM 14237]MBO0593371.1 hypothetical protein [Cellulophaga sp. E16_2]